MKITLFLFTFLFISQAAWAQNLSQNLEKLYRGNPGLVTQLNPELLRVEAAKVFKDPATAASVVKALQADLPGFMAARAEVITKIRQSPNTLRRVVVSGQSVTGMVNAAIAAQSGHKVDVYDLRMTYTRDIQWSSRQSVLDTLAAIDPQLAEKYKQRISSDLKKGYLEIKPDGTSKHYTPASMESADPRRIPQTAAAMLDERSVSIVQTKVFEELLYDYLKNHPNVVQTKGKIELGPIDPKTGRHLVTEYKDVTPKGQKEKVYEKIRTGDPITVIAEGTGSSNRAALGIQNVPVSPSRLQIAGVVIIENSGEIVTHYRNESPGRMVTGSMGTEGSGERWVVADIDPAAVTPKASKFGTDPSSPEYKTERGRLIEAEFKRIASLNMRMPIDKVSDLKVGGAIEGLALQTFDHQQKISNKAASGSNVLLQGDAVGSGHWSVGGGMHVGAVSHPERFKQYLTEVDGGRSEKAAALAYSSGALADSQVWGEKGLYYFYNHLSHEDATKAYRESIILYNQGKVETPERALELMLPGGKASRSLKNIRLACPDIVKYVLGEI